VTKERRRAIADCFAVRATESVSNGAKTTGEQMSNWKQRGWVVWNSGAFSVMHREDRFGTARGRKAVSTRALT